MIRHITICFLLALPVAQLAAADPQKAPEEPKGMKSLFNGKDLTGWDGDPRLWSVKDGVIHGETTPEKAASGNTFLISKAAGKLSDFELRLSFRCTATNNSGIQYRSKHITDSNRNKWVVKGYQHEIRNEVKMPSVSGFIYGEGIGRGRICLVGEKAVWKGDKKEVVESLITEKEFGKLFKLDDWNDVIIIAKGNRIQHYMNGRLILDFTDDAEHALKEGIIALQLHAGKPMWAEYKNVRVKVLD